MHRVEGVMLDGIKIRQLKQHRVSVAGLTGLYLLLFVVHSAQFRRRPPLSRHRLWRPEILRLKLQVQSRSLLQPGFQEQRRKYVPRVPYYLD